MSAKGPGKSHFVGSGWSHGTTGRTKLIKYTKYFQRQNYGDTDPEFHGSLIAVWPKLIHSVSLSLSFVSHPW